jgi:DGQHR domain-containing protein
VKGQFGSRLATYSAQVPLLQITKLLGHDPRPSKLKNADPEVRALYEQVQRIPQADRRRGIADYLVSRFRRRQIAAYPAVSIALLNHVSFEQPDMKSPLGRLLIDDEDDGMRILVDGLGRIAGSLELAERDGEGREIVKSIMVPVTVYAPAEGTPPLTIDEVGQIFHDFNFKVRRVPAAMAIRLDHTDLYIQLAREIAEAPFVDDFGGVDEKRPSLGGSSTELVTLSVLYRVVRGACEGAVAQMSNASSIVNANLSDETYDVEKDQIIDFFTEISMRMGSSWAERRSIHLTSAGWQALGLICHDIYHGGLDLTPAQLAKVYNEIANVDWSRKNRTWTEIGLGTWGNPDDPLQSDPDDPDNEVIIHAAGRSARAALHDYLRRKTGLQQLLERRTHA